jgi:hypothetical protein
MLQQSSGNQPQRGFICWALALLAASVLGLPGAAAQEQITPVVDSDRLPAYRSFSTVLGVSRLPAGCESLPIACPLDLSALLAQLHVAGAVDERSLRLFEIDGDGPSMEVPAQYLAAPQARPNGRKLLAGTPGSVSFAAEYPAGETPPAKSTGELFWTARAPASGTARYRLQFGVLAAGRMVQVPYPPHNLRAFDAAGRATLSPPIQFSRMQVRPQRPLAGAVQLLADNEPVLGYQVGPQPRGPLESGAIRRPFLYPVVGPDKIPLTEFGKPHDPTDSHAHHYSLWVAHADVSGEKFWGESGGVIRHEQLAALEDGPVFCRVVQNCRWITHETPHLLERRQTTLYRTPEPFRLFDIDLELAAPAGKPVRLGKTSFGFLAARVAQSMSVFDGGGEIVNSAGDCNEQVAHLKRAKWLDQSGPVAAGKWNGLAMMDHPSNPHHPTVWHCRNDGWAGASFNGAEAFVIESGQPLRLRYRIYLHRGNAEAGQVARFFEMYAAQPLVEVGKPVQDSRPD